jgi:hypothetical protein
MILVATRSSLEPIVLFAPEPFAVVPPPIPIALVGYRYARLPSCVQLVLQLLK